MRKSHQTHMAASRKSLHKCGDGKITDELEAQSVNFAEQREVLIWGQVRCLIGLVNILSCWAVLKKNTLLFRHWKIRNSRDKFDTVG